MTSAATKPWSSRIPAPYYFSSLITLILLIGELGYGILGGYERWAVALGSCIVVEIALSLLLRGRFPNLLSAYISGNSVAILLKPAGGTAYLWPFWIAGFLAIASKYVLTYRGRHLWNPTNFSVTILILIAPHTCAALSHQWGNEWIPVAIIYSVGFLVLSRARITHISLTFIATFFALALVRSGLDLEAYWREIGPITGPMYSLFIFFMITDPRTIVRGRGPQILVALIIGIVDHLIRWAGNHEVAWVQGLLPIAPLFALFTIGPIAFVISHHLGREAPAPARGPIATGQDSRPLSRTGERPISAS